MGRTVCTFLDITIATGFVSMNGYGNARRLAGPLGVATRIRNPADARGSGEDTDMDAFEKWKNSSWKEQVDSRQPVVCLGCLNQDRAWKGRLTCTNLDALLEAMRIAHAKVKCPFRATH